MHFDDTLLAQKIVLVAYFFIRARIDRSFRPGDGDAQEFGCLDLLARLPFFELGFQRFRLGLDLLPVEFDVSACRRVEQQVAVVEHQ